MVEDIQEPGDVQDKADVQREGKTRGNVKEPEFENFQDAKKQGGMRDMDFLLDIPVEVAVQLGTTRMLIKELLQLGQGSVVELEKLAGEPMEIMANHKLIARGEVVVVNEKFGVRLTDIISTTDRITQLK